MYDVLFIQVTCIGRDHVGKGVCIGSGKGCV